MLSLAFNVPNPREEQTGLVLAVTAFANTLLWTVGVKELGYGEIMRFRLHSLWCQYVFGVLQQLIEVSEQK